MGWETGLERHPAEPSALGTCASISARGPYALCGHLRSPSPKGVTCGDRPAVEIENPDFHISEAARSYRQCPLECRKRKADVTRARAEGRALSRCRSISPAAGRRSAAMGRSESGRSGYRARPALPTGLPEPRSGQSIGACDRPERLGAERTPRSAAPARPAASHRRNPPPSTFQALTGAGLPSTYAGATLSDRVGRVAPFWPVGDRLGRVCSGSRGRRG